MKIKYFILVLILFQSILILAQEPMVAYRKEGIWHYFDTNGKLMWEPFMDVAGFPNGWCNGLLKASAMNITGDKADNIAFQRKQVLYDKKGKIAYQPKYDSLYRIITGFDKAGYIQLRDLDAEKLILCDKQGNVVYKSEHGFCQYLGDGVVAYIKSGVNTEGDNIHVLFDIKTKKVLNEVNCLGFLGDYERGAVFSFTEKTHYGMYDRTGKKLLPPIWDSDLLDNSDDILSTGFVPLQDTASKMFTLFNKKGQAVIKNIESVEALNNFYFSCTQSIEGDTKPQQFFLNNGKATKVDAEKYNEIVSFTEGGIIACKNDESNVTLLDKDLKNIAVIKGVKDIKAVQNHFWIQSNKDGFYDCFNEKGQKTGSIQAEAIGNWGFHHVPFMHEGKWGLAHENGKIIVKPQFEFNIEEIPPVENGYWGINVTLPDNNHRFDFYNFQGKLVMSSTSEKDGWDYILPQETVSYFYKMY